MREDGEIGKPALRERFRASLDAMDPAAARARAERIAERAWSLPELAAANHVLTCLSFGVEVDTWKLADRLLAAGKSLYVPRADPRDRLLHVHPYPCPLRTLAFGLQQPPRGTPELPAGEIDGTIDVVLVLGLGFDRRGFRLGYGSGYFDRFLAGRPFAAIGLAYELQVDERLPAEAHDIPMAAIVTESAIVRPRSRV
jgi:5-formyltetrahydrofolate cyclo-ligase